MTVSRIAAIRSLEAVGSIIKSHGLDFSRRAYAECKRPEHHSWNAIRFAIGSDGKGRNGEPAPMIMMTMYARHPVEEDRADDWTEYIEPMVFEYGYVTYRFYNEQKEADWPTASTLMKRSGMSWSQMVKSLADKELKNGRVEWRDALLDMMDLNGTDLTERDYMMKKSRFYPSVDTILKSSESGEWEAAKAEAIRKIEDEEDIDVAIDNWLKENP